jgi:ABC-type multidrug transport system ATPase subunit
MIVAENLTYTYANAHRPAITESRVAVGTGEIVGFLGLNGAGKSTIQGSLRTIRDVAWQAACY